MRHAGLKVRMMVVGSILFAFYALLALVAYSMGFGLGIIAVGTVLFVGFQYVVGKKVALWSTGAEDMPKERYPKIHESVERLSEEMGIEKPRLMVADMGVPNAFAVGRRGAGVVVVSSELMRLLTHEELEGVLAHELAHIRNRDVVLMVVGQSIAMMAGLAVQFAVLFTRDRGIANFFVAYLAGILTQMLVMVFVLAISRYREYVADSDAAEYVGNEPMASALEKINAAGSGQRAEVNDNVSALCIFGGERTALERVFATHPPIEKRIAALRG